MNKPLHAYQAPLTWHTLEELKTSPIFNFFCEFVEEFGAGNTFAFVAFDVTIMVRKLDDGRIIMTNEKRVI